MHVSNAEAWIVFALIAMLFNVGKVLSVKTLCRDIDPSVLIFWARLLPAVLLVVPAWYSGYAVVDAVVFWGATVLAAVLTMAASLLYVRAMQLGDISLVSPIQASVPVFMVLTTWFLFDEKPGPISFLLILLIASAVAWVLLRSSNGLNKGARVGSFAPVLMSFAAAMLYGISTIVDRVAIAATTQGALLYSACWHVVTVLLMSRYLWRHHGVVFALAGKRRLAIAVYVAMSTGAFVVQQLAVQGSLDIHNGVTYVKAIVMLHIGIAALVGLLLLRERLRGDLLVANVVAIGGGVGLILSV